LLIGVCRARRNNSSTSEISVGMLGTFAGDFQTIL